MRACGIELPTADVSMLDVAEPPSPGAGQVLLEVAAAGVGNWDDLVRTGGWDVGLQPPAALGVEGAGRVIEVGPDVTAFAPGDAVLVHEAPLPGGSGFWSERVLVTAASLARRPAELDAVSAAALPVGGLTARQALDLIDLQPGSRVLITGGAGGTGALLVQIAARMGLSVTTTASPANEARLLGLGAERVLDYHDASWPQRLGRSFDGAVAAASGTAEQALELVRDGGRLCSLTSDAPAAVRDIVSENMYVAPDADLLGRLAVSVAGGDLIVEPEPVPLRYGAQALQRVLDGTVKGRKVVLVPS